MENTSIDPTKQKTKFNKKRIFKFLIGIILLTIIAFGFYLYKLHSLSIKGNNLFAYRCTNVNPHLIGYKNSFLQFSDYLKNPDTYKVEQARGFFDSYIAGMRAYVPEEDKWLEMQKKFSNRWDFKLFEPWYIKQAAEYQLKMYEGYRDDAKYMLEVVDTGGLTEELNAKFNDARQRRNEYSQKYYNFFDEASALNDWRKFFSYVPLPEVCTEQNLTIPNTSGSIDWEGKSATPSPTILPIDPDLAT